MKATAERRFSSPDLTASLRRLMTKGLDWFAVLDLTTTAPVHYVSLTDAMRRGTDLSDDKPFIR